MKQLLICIGLACAIMGRAQDIHLSQPGLQPLLLSPANCAQQASLSVDAAYRQQWVGAKAPFQTQLLSVQTRNRRGHQGEGFFAAGLQIQRDAAAQSLFNNAVQLNLAYHLPLNRYSFVAAGLQVGYGQRIFEPGGEWGSQYNGLSFDPNLSPSMILQNRYTFSYFDAGMGFAYSYERGQVREKTLSTFHASLGAAHLNGPSFQFLGSPATLKPRFTFYSQAEWCMGSTKTALLPLLFFQSQKPAQELVYGCAFKHYLKGGVFSRISNTQSAGFGLYNRWKDAVIIQFQLQMQQFRLSCAYDVTVSSFAKAPHFQSAFELQLGFQIE